MAKAKTKQKDDGGEKKTIFVRYSYSFAYADLLDLYVEDDTFRKAVDSGHYLFIDEKIVLNAPESVSYTDGRLQAKIEHGQENAFCLHYRNEIEWLGRQRGVYRYSPGRRCHAARPARKYRQIKSELEDASRINSVNDVTFENILAIVGGGHGPGENFSEALTRFMEESNVTEEELSELTGLAPKTIQRMRNPNLRTSLKSVVAVCVALSLDLYNSIYLVHLAGFELTNSHEDKVYYLFWGLPIRKLYMTATVCWSGCA